ncbi:MAG TPA: transporter [Burkholderiales bacterium]|nr:transporter [Burkholderiales bacterium]
MTHETLWLRALLAAFAIIPAAAHAQGLTLSTGIEYSSGKYGETEKTEMYNLPVTAKYETGLWTFRLSLPIVRVTGPANVVVVGDDVVTIPGASTARRTETGLGDLTGSAFYNLLDERTSQFGLDVGAKVKLGTADEDKGLGTGENDHSVQADVYKPVGDATTAFGSLGYRFYGDPPGVDLRSVFYGSLGGSYRISPDSSFGLAYDFRPRITDGGSQVSEATAFLSQRVSREMKLQYYGVKGFADGSPDFALGVMLIYAYQ